ncbi:Hypothetical predicted protein [Mytilus galloprovincialis]|uniref:TNFR-Cys domain-containing protein n=1 Tax=Mytilus galloprovincialis TaxID=29158 RepID=A0A8B6GXW2_MYTGA|nr:Hypothetical predicted protein [Mytilus galloprovincialis]
MKGNSRSDNMNIFLLIIQFCLICYSFSESKEQKCLRTLSNGESEWHCCDNKEDRNGICIVCPDGFLSEDGEPCHPCPKNTFGRKCGGICSCPTLQRCDNIQGCLNHSVNEIHSTMASGILRPEIISLICTGFLTLIVMISMLWFRHYIKKKHKRDVRVSYSRQNELEINKLEVADKLPDKEIDHYHYIRDSQIGRTIVPRANPIKHVTLAEKENRSCLNSEVDIEYTASSFSDGYLNPYQPMVSCQDSHEYSGQDIESVCQHNKQEDTTSTDVENTNKEVIRRISFTSENSYNEAISVPSNKNFDT